MLLGDILLELGLVQAADLEHAQQRQKRCGGRLGDNLIAMGVVSSEQIEAVLHTTPPAPRKLEDSGILPGDLLKLVIKTVHANSLETPSQMEDRIKLPVSVLNRLLDEAIDRKLFEILGPSSAMGFSESRYALTQAGRNWAIQLLAECQYFGPAPVSLDAYQERIQRQRITNERIDRGTLESAFADMELPEGFLRRLGPAVNSGRCILLYGAAGNGKTSIAERVGRVFNDVIYIPHCVDIDGQIIKIFDPAIHEEVARNPRWAGKSLLKEEFDQRWVACRRPVITAGGELTLEMLDLKFNAVSRFYEAPLHVKAFGGTFIIDDFGRQLVSPEDLLNRWIVPLQSRVDYLKLHSGKSFSLPFDELVVFSTNMSPNDLMDPAFLRRIPYKLEILPPSREAFERIFRRVAASEGLTLSDDIFAFVLDELQVKSNLVLASYHPRFVVDQVVAACKYLGIPPCFTREMVCEALANLYVKETPSHLPRRAAA